MADAVPYEVGKFQIAVSAMGTLRPTIVSQECENLPQDAVCRISVAFVDPTTAPEPHNALMVGILLLSALFRRRIRHG